MRNKVTERILYNVFIKRVTLYTSKCLCTFKLFNGVGNKIRFNQHIIDFHVRKTSPISRIKTQGFLVVIQLNALQCFCRAKKKIGYNKILH